MTVKRKRGGLKRSEASARALTGVDTAEIDPVAVLQEVAGDKSAPASARVSAARALLKIADEAPEAADDVDELTTKALKLMKGGRQ